MSITTEEAEQMAEICDQLGGFAQCAAALRSLAAERDKAQGYLSRCLQSLYPNIEPLPDLLGVCTQIDNVLAGQKAENARLRAALKEYDDAFEDWFPFVEGRKDDPNEETKACTRLVKAQRVARAALGEKE
jgi:hypothetical protein